jgi:hypothetical protein
MRPANFIVPAYARVARAALDAHQSPGRSFGHDRRMKTFLFGSSLALCAGLVSAQDIAMKEQAGLRFACGGAGFEKRAELKSLRPQATVELLFITAKRGGYLADVEVAVFDADKGAPVLRVTGGGPDVHDLGAGGEIPHRSDLRRREAQRPGRDRRQAGAGRVPIPRTAVGRHPCHRRGEAVKPGSVTR